MSVTPPRAHSSDHIAANATACAHNLPSCPLLSVCHSHALHPPFICGCPHLVPSSSLWRPCHCVWQLLILLSDLIWPLISYMHTSPHVDAGLKLPEPSLCRITIKVHEGQQASRSVYIHTVASAHLAKSFRLLFHCWQDKWPKILAVVTAAMLVNLFLLFLPACFSTKELIIYAYSKYIPFNLVFFFFLVGCCVWRWPARRFRDSFGDHVQRLLQHKRQSRTHAILPPPGVRGSQPRRDRSQRGHPQNKLVTFFLHQISSCVLKNTDVCVFKSQTQLSRSCVV